MRLYKYVFIMAGIMALFNVAGISTNVGMLLGKLGLVDAASLSNIQGTSMWTSLITSGLASIAAAGVVVGIYGRSQPMMPIKAGISTGFLAYFISDMSSIVQYINQSGGWLGYFIYLVMLPLIVGYLISMVDWVGGTD